MRAPVTTRRTGSKDGDCYLLIELHGNSNVTVIVTLVALAKCLGNLGQRVARLDFLESLVGSASFMRLSLMKGAHSALSSGAYRKFGDASPPHTYLVNVTCTPS
jgi:hypothetical protein